MAELQSLDVVVQERPVVAPAAVVARPRALRVPILDSMRGVAAAAVAVMHFTYANPAFGPYPRVQALGAYGAQGVTVFFVISGFVLPYALHTGGYRLAAYPRFLLKRIVRLEPPYLASMVVALVLGFAASAMPGFHGKPFVVTLPQLALHLGYLNSYFGYESLIPVYWTLAIEFQWYLALGLLYPLLSARSERTAWGTVAVLAALTALAPTNDHLIFRWLPLFLMGVITYRYRVDHIARRTYLLALGALALLAGVVGAPVDPAYAIAGTLGSLAIAFHGDRPLRGFAFLGAISYSLYLLHVVIGVRVLNLSQRMLHGFGGAVLGAVLAFLASVVAAWLFHRAIEAPSQAASGRVSYRTTER